MVPTPTEGLCSNACLSFPTRCAKGQSIAVAGHGNVPPDRRLDGHRGDYFSLPQGVFPLPARHRLAIGPASPQRLDLDDGAVFEGGLAVTPVLMPAMATPEVLNALHTLLSPALFPCRPMSQEAPPVYKTPNHSCDTRRHFIFESPVSP